MIQEGVLLELQTSEHSGKIQGIKTFMVIFFMGTAAFLVGLWYPVTINAPILLCAIFIASSMIIFTLGTYIHS